ncbi:MAG: lysophospholipid acyltransferase family protein [Spirochaetales bacterium]|nr:lysophospholipid acyltransferase family protein [Spirochaetales bacterium]
MNSSEDQERAPGLRERFSLWLIPWLVVALQRFVGLTAKRVDLNNEGFLDLQSSGRPFILSIWHTNVLYSPFLHRNRNITVMISSSRDGELITRIVKHFGNLARRGSTSRGGLRALKQIIGVIKGGSAVAITPDGPRGPALKVQGGLLTIAQQSGAPIIPFHYECTRQKIALKAWDKHRIPLPFTTFVVRYGDPVYVPRTLSSEEWDGKLQEIEYHLLENMKICRTEVRRLRRRRKS